MSVWRRLGLVAGLLVIDAGATVARAADPSGPLSPEASQALFQIVPGHVVELVAAEPLVFDPVAICWDADGRPCVAEMSDYPNGDGGGRIVTLADTDGDGVIDQRTVFAAGLPFPNGLMAWRGGLLVTAAPDILWLADTDGDGLADVREVVLTGFNAGNQQLRVNGLSLGPDGWVYAANGRSGGAITSPRRPGAAPVSIDRHDLRFNPDSGEVEAVAGFSQFGLAFDARGNRFSNWNTAPIRHVVFPLDVATRHPLAAPPTDTEVLEDPVQQNRLFPISGTPTTFNREPTDAFNASCGLSIDRGSLLAPGGCAYVCEPLLNLVHRRELVPRGVSFEARRPAGEEDREFLASSDPWFRPVFTAIGPDGALWICDFYRRFVEHPDFVTAELRGGIEWDEGKDRGRIWRVRPPARPARAGAERLRADDPSSPDRGMTPARVAARDRLAKAGGDVVAVASELAGTSDPTVRFDVALAAETLEPAARAMVLARVLATEPADPWVDRAVLCVAEDAAPRIVQRLATAEAGDTRLRRILRGLAESCGRRAEDGAELSRIVASVDFDDRAALALLAGLARGRRAGGGPHLPESFGGLPIAAWMEKCRAVAGSAAVGDRDDAVELLALDDSVEAEGILVGLLAEPLGIDDGGAILRALRGRDPGRVADGILAGWPAASPAVRRMMLDALFRPEGFADRMPRFLSALEAGEVSPGDIAPDARHAILASDFLAPADRSRLEALLGGAASADRAAVVAAVGNALPESGDRNRGMELFSRHCAGCHRSGGIGARVGPDLAAMHAKPRSQLVEDILDPNRRLTGEYAAVAVLTREGDAFVGLVSGETPTAVQLTIAEGKIETIPRSAIEVFRGTGKSLMPEGFEQALRPEDLADVIEFLTARR